MRQHFETAGLIIHCRCCTLMEHTSPALNFRYHKPPENYTNVGTEENTPAHNADIRCTSLFNNPDLLAFSNRGQLRNLPQKQINFLYWQGKGVGGGISSNISKYFNLTKCTGKILSSYQWQHTLCKLIYKKKNRSYWRITNILTPTNVQTRKSSRTTMDSRHRGIF